MGRIKDAFNNKPIFMPYFPLGYPALDVSIDVIEALAKNGADLIELGLSFSDPLADGPVIQKATQLALKNGITVRKALKAVAELRRRAVNIPLLLMSYYNPLLAYGLQELIADAHSAGADGFIVPDLPPEEAEEFESMLDRSSLILIRMLAPTSPPIRMESVAQSAQGFIYLVSVTGVTGARQSISDSLPELIRQVREYTPLPVCVGFGIGTPEQAKAVGAVADGVIVGSACVRAIGESKNPVESAREFARSYQAAMHDH